MMNSFRTLVSRLRTFTPCASERFPMLCTSLPFGVRVARMTSALELAQGGSSLFAATSSEVLAAQECRSLRFGADWRADLERAILPGMAYEYRVTEAADGTFPVELWSSKGGREQLVYKTPGFQTRELAEAWTVPVEVQSVDPAQPRARVTYLKPRRSRVVVVSKPNPLPPPVSPPALPES